jgi:hypothetical protein
MSAGIKYDGEKLRWSLVPWREMEEVVRVLEVGAKKYAPDNWKRVSPKTRYWNAAMRHMVEWAKGVRRDKDDDLHPLAHAICCLLFLMWKDRQ